MLRVWLDRAVTAALMLLVLAGFWALGAATYGIAVSIRRSLEP